TTPAYFWRQDARVRCGTQVRKLDRGQWPRRLLGVWTERRIFREGDAPRRLAGIRSWRRARGIFLRGGRWSVASRASNALSAWFGIVGRQNMRILLFAIITFGQVAIAAQPPSLVPTPREVKWSAAEPVKLSPDGVAIVV